MPPGSYCRAAARRDHSRTRRAVCLMRKSNPGAGSFAELLKRLKDATVEQIAEATGC
jgi:hypothetical protein